MPTGELRARLTQMAQVCQELAHYVEHPHFDGYDIRRAEFDELMIDLPQLIQAWDRTNSRIRTDLLLKEQAQPFTGGPTERTDTRTSSTHPPTNAND